jgi:serine/threonine protein kinase
MSNLVGQQIAHYQIKALLGQGRVGTVYQAIDLEDLSSVALKVVSLRLTQQPEFRRSFLQEVQAIPRLDHPSIVKVHEAGVDTEQDILYMTMDYVTERSLMAYLQQLTWRGEKMRPGEALLVGAQVADALDYAHQKGVVHRDIRPNVILFKLDDDSVTIGGQPRRAVISDFALASVLEGETEPFPGALPYMSPEQCLKKQLDGRSDLYSLGVVLYQLITGQLPFAIESLDDAIRQHQYQDPLPPSQLRPDLPAGVEDVIMTALAGRPDERFQSGSEMAKALRRTVSTLPEAMAATVPEDAIISVDTQFEPQEMLAMQANQWSSDDDRVTITENIPRSLNRQLVTIGRSENNDIVLPSTSVTRRHAQLERTAEGWQIRDLGSMNGTFLDGHPLLPDIPEEWLGHQTLRIGPYFLQLQHGSGFTYSTRSFDVLVTPYEIDVFPGEQQDLQVTIANQGEETEEYEIGVERLPSAWIEVPDDPLRLRPKEQATATVTIRPPLSKDTITGTSRYLIVVKPCVTEQEEITVPGIVNVGSPQESFSIEMHPAGSDWNETYQLLIRNSGITEANFMIVGNSSAETVRFGEWRPKDEDGAGPLPADRSRQPRSLPRSSPLKQLPQARRLQRAPRSFMYQIVGFPRRALNRIMPGLGNTLRPNQLGKKTISPPGSREPRGSRMTYDRDRSRLEKVIYPGQLRTQEMVAAGQQKEISLIVAPKKRPLLGRNPQTVPFQIQVGTATGDRQSVAGEVIVKPRVRTRLPAGVFIVILLFICALSTVLLVSTVNQTLAAILSSPRDIDADGLTNLAEVYVHKTDPNNPDSDDDGLSDGQEIELALLPTDPDTDNDGLLDGQEQALNTNPLTFDSDGDELSDSLEVNILKTDPLSADTLPIVFLVTPTPTPRPTRAPIPTLPPTPTPSSRQMSFTSEAPQDGFVGQEGTISGRAIAEGGSLQVGDDLSDSRQFKGIVSFDTSSLPDEATVLTARLRLRSSGIAGTPTKLGQIHVDIAPGSGFGGSPALQHDDFGANAAIVNVVTLSGVGAIETWAEGILDASNTGAINRQGVTQFRLYFTLPNDGNGDRDWISFYSGDHPDNSLHPQLIVSFEVP